MFMSLLNAPVNAQQAPPVNSAPAQSSPLDNLRDIHLPENIDQFPSAIGWWVLLGILIYIIGFIIFKTIKKHRALRYLRTAKLELISLSEQPANNVSLSQLSALLKRVCLIYYPSNSVASLSGHAWWDFVNNEAGQKIYNEDDIKQLSQSRYQKDSAIDKTEYTKLIEKTEKCIGLIVRQSIKKKGKKQTKEQNDNFSNGVAQ
ncbi:MAG: hypothetical protein COA86_14170 [Kangiella sp.]|nr:MAG: hypothetical protein COA86_14170 [Kangiella sp.]